MHPFHHFLSERTKKSLPGKKAQLKMQPVPLQDNFSFPEPDAGIGQPSSVLIPLFSDSNRLLQVILTLRTESVSHAGQISFPGGRSEKHETPLTTALRETEEEIGITPDLFEIAGSLSPLYLYRSNNQITPFIGFLEKEPKLTPNPSEVEEVFTVPLDSFMKDDLLIWEEWRLREITMNVPYWKIHPTPLWGATAMMMSELLELYREFLEQ